MKEPKSEEIHIRMSPTEKKKIEERAALANKSVASYLIELSESKRIVDTSKLPPLITEIRRIGTNINQIAAVANSQKYVSKAALQQVTEKQKEIISLLQEILEEVYDTEEHSIRNLEEKSEKQTEAIQSLEEKIESMAKTIKTIERIGYYGSS